jgi:hypothetical protein
MRNSETRSKCQKLCLVKYHSCIVPPRVSLTRRASMPSCAFMPSRVFMCQHSSTAMPPRASMCQ